MSIYATLWTLKFPKDGNDYISCDWIEVMAQGVPAHIGSPTPGCGYEIAETVHSMNQSQQAFRLVIKREKRQKDLFEQAKYFYHVIATNCSEQEKSALEVIQWHNQRGSAENFNKELKNGFGMERMPCGQSYANAVFFRIGVIAYNLFIGFKRLSCPESWATKDD